MLYDSYQETGQCEKATKIHAFIQSTDEILASKLDEYQAVVDADFCALEELSNQQDEDIALLISTYSNSYKSPRKAELLNGILPGAGYYYVGQKTTALTSFIINALFTYAAYQFFDHGYIAAGCITTSLELGWYLGGINGAGIAARDSNERAYEAQSKNFLINKRLFPVLMFSHAF